MAKSGKIPMVYYMGWERIQYKIPGKIGWGKGYDCGEKKPPMEKQSRSHCLAKLGFSSPNISPNPRSNINTWPSDACVCFDFCLK